MAVNAPTLTSVADLATGGALRLSLTPPAAGDYDHCQILHRPRDASAWTTGPTYVGAQGVAGTVDVTGLTNGAIYEVLAYAVDVAGAGGPPSVTIRRSPSAGDGSLAERIEARLKTVLLGITQSSGYWDDVEACYRFGVPPDLEDADWPVALLRCQRIENEEGPLCGANGATVAKMQVLAGIAATRPAAQADADWVPKEALRALDAITKAILEDPTQAGLALDTEAQTGTPNPDRDQKLGDAVAVATFTVTYRHQRDNPSLAFP